MTKKTKKRQTKAQLIAEIQKLRRSNDRAEARLKNMTVPSLGEAWRKAWEQ